MAYKLQCVQSYSRQDQADTNALDVVTSNTENILVKESGRTTEPFIPSEYLKDLSKEEIMDLCELNHLLDELGPQYKDWSGREPLPVDADLLPPIVPGYQPALRRLPYGEEIGNCKVWQAMVKLWERSAIAKIAIKRGVQHSRNERMAEELKHLTGGTLLSRNKEFIRRKEARGRALAVVGSNAKASTLPLVAGTLSETTAATSRWGHQPSPDEVEEMKRNSALTQQASHRTCSWEKRGVYDGTIENVPPLEIPRAGKDTGEKRASQVKHIAISLEAESGGVLVSLDKTTKGYAIIIYRGKNYFRPRELKPKNLLTKRQALARKKSSMKSELDETKAGKEVDPVKTPYLSLNEAPLSDEDIEEEDWEEEYLVSYDSGDDEGYEQKEPMPRTLF
ncbi:Detected protein of confused Function [Hibiscus syriacus]|uniref:Detected protein of confused Function n=1 Tax=Hibiscus syriacus TaxID=106335 RepID=A0A6A3CFX9_HIBSY|nr:Detected protein of confused Function [Hibiscus syriacus]